MDYVVPHFFVLCGEHTEVLSTFYFGFVVVSLFSPWSYQMKPKNASEGVLNLSTVFWEAHNRAERAGAFGVPAWTSRGGLGPPLLLRHRALCGSKRNF